MSEPNEQAIPEDETADVEGHRKVPCRDEDGEPEVEGHMRARRDESGEDDELDVEGHAKKSPARGEDDEPDVEGHRYRYGPSETSMKK